MKSMKTILEMTNSEIVETIQSGNIRVCVIGIDTESSLINVLPKCDGVILVTSHKEFHDIDPKFLKSQLRNPVFIDSRCMLNQHEVINAGLIYRGLGREKF